MEPILKSSKIIKRYEKNPILTSSDCKFASDLVFNPGVVKWKDKYIMIFRNDYGHIDEWQFEGTNLGIAFSDDGINWNVEEKPFFTMDMIDDRNIKRFYDPRLTVIDNELYMCFAVDTNYGTRGGVGRISDDLKKLEVISMTAPDNRNLVLFPEKINGKYVRLERPFPIYGKGGKDSFDIWISKSPDLRYWGDSELLVSVKDIPYANDKIGPAAPPIKTDKGWLVLFHAVDTDEKRGKNGWEKFWKKRYSAGIMLVDKNEPSKILGIYKNPLIAPEAQYEVSGGFRNHAIFPCGMVLEDDGMVKIYYGAADIVICMAEAHVNELIELCLNDK